jgi:cytochrome d ubiquinol oxidase subunit I
VLLFFRCATRAPRDAGQGWLDAYRFWVKVFALTFALGVVSASP